MCLCDFGCGNEAKYLFKSGKWCCSKSHNSCEAMKNKNSNINKGRIFSKETREKMSASCKGRVPWNKNMPGFIKHTEETKLKISCLHKGRKLTIKHKRKLSESNKNKIVSEKTKNLMKENHADFSGKNNPNWKGGIGCEPYCEIWSDEEYKNSIKERDGYICINPYCYKNSKRLTIHHINYNKKDCKPSNLITLCNSCNAYANKDRKWHKFWYKAILYMRYGII